MVFLMSRFLADFMGLLALRLICPKKDALTSLSSFLVISSATFFTISLARFSTSPFIICFSSNMVFNSSLLGSSFRNTSGSVKSSVIPYFSNAWRSIISTVRLGNNFFIWRSQLGMVSFEPSLPPLLSSRSSCSSPYSLEYR